MGRFFSGKGKGTHGIQPLSERSDAPYSGLRLMIPPFNPFPLIGHLFFFQRMFDLQGTSDAIVFPTCFANLFFQPVYEALFFFLSAN